MRNKGKRVLFLDSDLRVTDVVRYDDPNEAVSCPEGCSGFVTDNMGMFQIGDIYRHLDHRNAIVKLGGMRDKDFIERSRRVVIRGKIIYAMICYGYDLEAARDIAENSGSMIAKSFLRSHFTEQYQRTCYSVLWIADVLKIPPNQLDEIFDFAMTIDLWDLQGSLKPEHYRLVKEYEDKHEAKRKKELALNNLTVEVNGKVFDADDVSVVRIFTAMLTGKESMKWKLADNTIAETSCDELQEVLSAYSSKVSDIILGAEK